MPIFTIFLTYLAIL